MTKPQGIRPDVHARFERVLARAIARQLKAEKPRTVVPGPDGGIIATGCYWKRPAPTDNGD